jgi:tetratricopeptide (TPR) repeat protein
VLNAAVFSIACALIYSVYRRNKEWVTFGTAFFILTLMPTLPFHFAGQPYADRYTYLPLAGILMIISAFSLRILPKKAPPRRFRGYLVGTILGLSVLVLGARTWSLSHVWHDSISLWTNVLRIDPENSLALLNRGLAYSDAGQMDKALADFNKGEQLEPENPNIINNRGSIYFKQGEYDKALNDFNRSIDLDPRFQLGYLNRAILWGRMREFEKTVQDCTSALEINKSFYRAYYYRATAYKELNLKDRALADFKTAYMIFPSDEVRREIDGLSGQRDP